MTKRLQYSRINLDRLLRERRLIAHIWGVEDVQSIRPDLNADQAWTVLQQIEKDLDSGRGITWDDLRDAANELLGPAPSGEEE